MAKQFALSPLLLYNGHSAAQPPPPLLNPGEPMVGRHDERVQTVDVHNRKTGSQPRSRMRAEGLTHRACYILVFNDRGDLFLQKRTDSKDIYPGFWDVAAGGVVLAGESYEESAVRELAEELGVEDVALNFLFDHYHEGEGNRVWGRVFSCRHNGPFVLQKDEIASGRFISVAEALTLSKHQPFTPDGLEILWKIQNLPAGAGHQVFFLHGLDSSGQGSKGRFFAEHFPHVHCPDFAGTLDDRLHRLIALCWDRQNLILIGSSFGGLMATCYALRFQEKVARLILLAPALNFEGFRPPRLPSTVPVTLHIGRHDTVTPPDLVLPLARATFARLTITLEDDDHLLHDSFPAMPWHELLLPERPLPQHHPLP